MSNLGWSVCISFGFSFSLGNEVPVVSKNARVSKVGASVAGVRKGVVGGDNSGGSVVSGDNSRGSVVGGDNSGGSVVGGNNSGGRNLGDNWGSVGNSWDSGDSRSGSIGYGTVANSSISRNSSISIVNSGDQSSVGLAKCDLSGGISFSIRFSFSLGNEVPVVSKDARVSKVGASVAGVWKSVVGGYNSGSGNFGYNWSSVGNGRTSSINSWVSSIGNGAGYGSYSNSGDESRSMSVVNTGDDSSGGLSGSYLKWSVSFGIGLRDNSGNSQTGNGKGSHCDELQKLEQSK